MYQSYYRSSSANKSKVLAQFMSVTQQSKDVAERILRSENYKLEPALNYYYLNQHRYPNNAPDGESLKQLDKVFDKYVDDSKENCSQAGLAKFFEDVGVDLAHRWTLFIMYLLKTATNMQISRKEFIDYFGKMKAFTINDIKKTCTKECKSIDNSDPKFAKFYTWLFTHVKENEQKRSIPKDFAIQLWEIVLTKKKYPLLEDLSKFASKTEEIKAITLDTWTVVLEFLKKCKDPKTFENDGAWPMLVDMYLDDAQA